MNENSQKVIHLDIFYKQIKRYWYLYLLLFIAIFLGCFLILRYTHPVYRAEAIVQVKREKELEMLAGRIPVEDLLNVDYSINLISSSEFLKKVVSKYGKFYTVYNVGEVQEYELNNTPFDFDYKIKDSSIIDIPVFIEIEKDNTFTLTYEINEKLFKYRAKAGEVLNTDHFVIYIHNGDISREANKRIKIIFKTVDEIVNDLQSNLRVYALNPSAGTIAISMEGPNPSKIVNTINIIANEFVLEDENSKKEVLVKQIQFIEEQIKNIEQQIKSLGRKNNKQEEPQMITGKTDVLVDVRTLKEQLSILNDLYTTLKNFNYQREKPYILIVKASRLPNNTIIVSEIKDLISKIETLDKLKKEYSEVNPKISDLLREIENQRELISFIIETSINDIKKKIEEHTGIKVQHPEELKITETTSIDVLRNIYSSLMEKKLDLTITMHGITGGNRILKRAVPSPTPIYPIKGKMVLYSVFLFILLSILLSLVLYITYNKVYKIEDVVRWANMPELPFLGYVPSVPRIKRTNIREVFYNSFLIDYLRTIRINIELLREKGDNRIIGVSSTKSGEGKTLCSVLISLIFNHGGKRVLLVDADLRKPSIHEIFDIENTAGLSSVIIEGRDFREYIRNVDWAKGLDILTAGPRSPNSAELIMSKNFTDFLMRASAEYDYVIVDTSPIGVVPEVHAIFKLANYPVYVFSSGFSDKWCVLYYLKFQKVTGKTLGIIINNIKEKSIGKGYGYYRGYGY